MQYGAGFIAAVAAGASEILDPRDSATPGMLDVFARFPHLRRVLPAMGYSVEQREALRKTIEASGADCVVAGTPIDLASVLGLQIPVVRARYGYQDANLHGPRLESIIDDFVKQLEGDGSNAHRRCTRRKRDLTPR